MLKAGKWVSEWMRVCKECLYKSSCIAVASVDGAARLLLSFTSKFKHLLSDSQVYRRFLLIIDLVNVDNLLVSFCRVHAFPLCSMVLDWSMNSDRTDIGSSCHFDCHPTGSKPCSVLSKIISEAWHTRLLCILCLVCIRFPFFIKLFGQGTFCVTPSQQDTVCVIQIFVHGYLCLLPLRL